MATQNTTQEDIEKGFIPDGDIAQGFVPDEPKQPSLTQVETPSVESEGAEPIATWSGMGGAVIRGLAPTAAQMGTGAAIGAGIGGIAGLLGGPAAPVSVPAGMAAGAQIGGVAAPILSSLYDLTITGVNAAKGTHYSTITDAVTDKLSDLGVAEPRTSAEKVTQAVTEGITSALAPAKLAAKGAAKLAPSATKGALEFLAFAPKTQAVAGGVAGAGSELAGQYAEELGFTPGQQLGARLLGGLTGGFGATTAIGAGEKLAKILPPSARRIEKEGENILRTVLAEQLPKGASETLAQVGKVGDEYFKPTSGKLLGTEKIMALENEFAKTSEEIASRNLENIRGVGQKIGEGLEEVGATPEESQAYYKNFLDTIKNRTDEELAAATAARDEKTLSVITPAAEKADAIKKSVEEGKITAEEGYKKTQEAYEQAFKDLKENANVNEMNASSEKLFDKIESQRQKEKVVIDHLYDKAEVDIAPFIPENMIASKDILLKGGEIDGTKFKGVFAERRIPQEIKNIWNDLVDKKGNPKPITFGELRSHLQEVNSQLRKVRPGTSEEKILEKFKEFINKDLDALEPNSDNLRIANNAYREYAQRYKEGASKSAYKQSREGFTSNTINQYIPDNVKNVKEEDIKRLKDVISQKYMPSNLFKPEQIAKSKIDEQEAIELINDWIHKKMASSTKGTSASIEDWFRSGGDTLVKYFPGAADKINEDLKNFRGLETAIDVAKKDVDLASKQRITGRENAAKVLKEARAEKKLIDEAYKAEVKKIESQRALIDEKNQALSKLVGGNPVEKIGSIMSTSATSEQNMQRLVEIAKQDQTGKAIEGLKNSVKRWLNREVRTTTQPTPETGIISEDALVNNFIVKLDKMNKVLEKNSPTRNAMEIVLGKDSPELAGLDNSRRQLDILARKPSLRAEKPEYQGLDTKASLNAKIAAIIAGNKGYLGGLIFDRVSKIFKGRYEKYYNKFGELFTEALLDPKIMQVLAEDLTQDNVNRKIALFGRYGMEVDRDFLNKLAVTQKAGVLPATKAEQEEKKSKVPEEEMGFIPEGFELQ